MTAPLKRILRVSESLGAATALLLIVTLVRPYWIELLFGVDPDHGDASTERSFVVLVGVATICSLVLARTAWRRLRLVAGSWQP
jgi:hypothetical protein